jgi:hypothetical protein
MVKRRESHEELVGKNEGKRTLGRCRRRRKYNIKVDLQKEGCGSGTRWMWLWIGTDGGHI